jgi:DNA-binding NarL/FixJ family response regulator
MGLSEHREFSTNGEPVNGLPLGVERIPQEHGIKSGSITGPVVIVHRRALGRECLARSLQEYNPALAILAVGSVEQVTTVSGQTRPSAILLILGDRKATDPTTRAELKDFVSQFGDVPVVVVADADGPAEMLAALDGGAKGYITTGASVKVLAEAIALARAGGVFVPASCIIALKEAKYANQANARRLADIFTPRQTSVANALRQGKANKIIAYELNMCESTVKVHVRNLMKKLKATNRTEIAYKLSEMAA